MTDGAPDRPSDQMAAADVANGESGVLDEGFEEQQGQRPARAGGADEADGHADDAGDEVSDEVSDDGTDHDDDA